MKAKRVFIISVISILTLFVLLLGITYAYFLTKIEGNDITNSATMVTADLRLKYSDGNGIITKKDIIPGTIIGEKTFSIENTGDSKIDDYAVSLEYAFLEGIVPSIFERPNDFEITLTCSYVKKDGTTGTCTGFSGRFNNENIIMNTNMIDSGEIHNYSLNIYYANPIVDQSNDMGKSLDLKVNIYRLSESADIVGEIIGVDETHTVKLNSEPKISSINKTEDNKYLYKFKGVPLGTHTISVMNEDGDIVGIHKILVEKGKNAVTGTKEITYEENGNTVTTEVPSISIKDNERVAEVTTNVDLANSKVIITETSLVTFNPYEANKNTLAYNIVNNAIKKLNNTILSEIPKTKPAEKVSTETEKTLSITQDDYGITHYFRGNVVDNYINYAGMCWRIIRIQGDGSIKLILEDQFVECDSESYTGNWNIGEGNYGYDGSTKSNDGTTLYKINYLEPVTNKSSSMVKAFYDFQTNKLSAYTNKLKSGDWCLNDLTYTRSGSSGSYKYTLLQDPTNRYLSKSTFYYNSYIRLMSGALNGYQPTLKCNGRILNEFKDIASVSSETPMYVSGITADEAVFAGAKYDSSNKNYYLINNYQTTNSVIFKTLSPRYFSNSNDSIFILSYSGTMGHSYVNYTNSVFRPSISLKTNVQIKNGDGTIEKPYEIIID